MRKLSSGKWEGAQTCNLAIWRADLDRAMASRCYVQRLGREDSDLVVRLLNAGIPEEGRRCATGVLASVAPGRRPLAPAGE